MVGPLPPQPIIIGKKVLARSRKAKLAEEQQLVVNVSDEEEEAVLEGEEKKQVEEEEIEKGPYKTRVNPAIAQWSDGKTFGMAVLKMIRIGDRENGGLVLSTAG